MSCLNWNRSITKWRHCFLFLLFLLYLTRIRIFHDKNDAFRIRRPRKIFHATFCVGEFLSFTAAHRQNPKLIDLVFVFALGKKRDPFSIRAPDADVSRPYLQKSARDFLFHPISPAKDFREACPSPYPPSSPHRRPAFRPAKCLVHPHRATARNPPASMSAAQPGWDWQRLRWKQLQRQRVCRAKIEQDSLVEWRCPGGASA